LGQNRREPEIPPTIAGGSEEALTSSNGQSGRTLRMSWRRCI